jgi:hypothetical protein
MGKGMGREGKGQGEHTHLLPWLLEKALLFGTREIVYKNNLIPLFSMTLRRENIIFRIPSEIISQTSP